MAVERDKAGEVSSQDQKTLYIVGAGEDLKSVLAVTCFSGLCEITETGVKLEDKRDGVNAVLMPDQWIHPCLV